MTPFMAAAAPTFPIIIFVYICDELLDELVDDEENIDEPPVPLNSVFVQPFILAATVVGCATVVAA